MTLPNFIIIGTTKAGTTSINHYLNQHPDVFMSPVKEPRFFAFEDETLTYQGPRGEEINSDSITKLVDYHALFQGAVREKAIGEASALYLYMPNAAKRIQYHIPDAKLITILRNPVDRAYSQFLHNIRDGFEPCTDFLSALQDDERRIQEYWEPGLYYQPWGFYAEQLQRYFDKFDRSQMRIYLYEDFEAHPQDIISDIFQFLEIDDHFEPNMSARYNVSGVPQNKAMHAVLSTPSWLSKLAKSLMPQTLRQAAMRMRNQNLAKPEMSEEARQYLVEAYRQDLLQLQTLIQRDLTAWLS